MSFLTWLLLTQEICQYNTIMMIRGEGQTSYPEDDSCGGDELDITLPLGYSASGGAMNGQNKMAETCRIKDSTHAVVIIIPAILVVLLTG